MLKKLLRGSFITATSKVIEYGLFFVIFAALAKNMSVVDFGAYVLLVSVIPFYSVLTSLGAQIYLLREASGNVTRVGVCKTYLRMCFAISIAPLVCAFCLWIINLRNIAIGLSDDTMFFIGSVIISGLLFSVLNLNSRLYAAREHYGLTSLAIPQNSGGVIFGVIFTALFFLDLASDYRDVVKIHILAMFIAALVTTFISILLLMYGEYVKAKNAPQLKLDKKAMVTMWANDASSMIGVQSDVWIVGALLSAEVLAHVGVAQRVSGVFLFAFFVINVVTGPIIAKSFKSKNLEQNSTSIRQLVGIFFAGSLLLLAIFLFFGESFLDIAFGEQYSSAYWLVIWLSISKLVAVYAGPTNTALSMSGHHFQVFKIMVSTTVLKLVILPIATFYFSVDGFVVATVLLSIVRSFLLIAFTESKLGVRLHATFRFGAKASKAQ